MSEPIYVSRPYLPPLSELLPLLEQIWETRMLTNSGPLHQQLEAKLCEVLDVEHISLVTNGMLALQLAIEAAGISDGEVITTPYSFVATSHAIRMRGLRPVFVDIQRQDLNIDPRAVESAITPRTRAIVAVHCYGNPCDVDMLGEIASRHNLTLIYDAAHAFGVRYRGRSLVTYGDFSSLSFHATKAFNTFEGGAVVARTADGKRGVDQLRNFGIADEITIASVGTNAKMSEFSAAVGLVQINHLGDILTRRGHIDLLYRDMLRNVKGIDILGRSDDVDSNFSYFPILVTAEYPLSRDELYRKLKANRIYSRRYFYPLLSSLPMYNGELSANPGHLQVANRAAEEVLCLPIYPELAVEDVERIADIVRNA